MTLRNISLLLLFIAFFSACEKEEENGMDFKITGLRDTVIQRGQSFNLPLKVFYLGGSKEKVTVTSEGNGNGVSISYDPATGEPDFSFTQYFTASATADTGLFTVTVTGTSESKKQFSKSFKLRVTEVTNSAPSLVLTQGDSVIQRLNDQWFDPGYTAIDPEDGNLTAQVQVSGSVNVNLMANYTLTYTVTDSDGLTTTKTRLVRVLNDIIYVNGQFNCTTFSSGPPSIFITTIAASTTVNNDFKMFKISDYFQADPIMSYNPANDSIFMSAQTFTVTSSVGTVPHTFQGAGKLTNTPGANVTVDITYTDTYTDTSTGTLMILNKRDLCIQQ
jgi:hypothetical protein